MTSTTQPLHWQLCKSLQRMPSATAMQSTSRQQVVQVSLCKACRSFTYALVCLTAIPTCAAGDREGAVRMFQPEEVSSALLQVMRNEQQCQGEVFIRCAEPQVNGLFTHRLAMLHGFAFQSASAQHGTSQHRVLGVPHLATCANGRPVHIPSWCMTFGRPLHRGTGTGQHSAHKLPCWLQDFRDSLCQYRIGC